MSTEHESPPLSIRGAAQFNTTHWSVVLAAGRGHTGQATAALQTLCRSYWYPLYCFARRLGHGPHDAEDLTQSFFAYFLETNLTGKAQPEKGKFRSFLLATFKHFLAGEWDRAQAQKRGGGVSFVSWENERAEGRYGLEPVDLNDPETLYEWSWAMALLDRVLARLEQEFAAIGKAAVFAELKSCLVGTAQTQSYAELGQRLSKTEAAVKEAVRRMRLRYRQLFREEIAQTVGSTDELDAEVRHVISILRS
jgi:DNA-directed RNA polymerase specialized sigma24 family protein